MMDGLMDGGGSTTILKISRNILMTAGDLKLMYII